MTVIITILIALLALMSGATIGARIEHRLMQKKIDEADELRRNWKGRYYDMMDSRDSYQKEMTRVHSSTTAIEYENDKLKAEIKDLNNELKGLSDSRDMYFKIVRHAEYETSQQASRIKELEAALARAEGLNRSLADGGVVSASIKPKDVQL